MFFRKKIVPQSNETKRIVVVQTWEVRYYSLESSPYGSYISAKKELEVFLSFREAEDFKDSIENAHKLLKSDCLKNFPTTITQGKD